MIVHNQVCNYCGDLVELPLECAEDSFFFDKNKEPPKCRVYGMSVDMCAFPIKSFENYRRRSINKLQNLTFCGKDCFVEFIKKFINDEGKLEIIK